MSKVKYYSPLEKTKAERDQEVSDLRQVMSTRAGRAFVWRILAEAGVFRISYTGNSDTYFNEGRRALGVALFADINEFCFGDYLKARSENEVMMERLADEQG